MKKNSQASVQPQPSPDPRLFHHTLQLMQNNLAASSSAEEALHATYPARPSAPEPLSSPEGGPSPEPPYTSIGTGPEALEWPIQLVDVSALEAHSTGYAGLDQCACPDMPSHARHSGSHSGGFAAEQSSDAHRVSTEEGSSSQDDAGSRKRFIRMLSTAAVPPHGPSQIGLPCDLEAAAADSTATSSSATPPHLMSLRDVSFGSASSGSLPQLMPASSSNSSGSGGQGVNEDFHHDPVLSSAYGSDGAETGSGLMHLDTSSSSDSLETSAPSASLTSLIQAWPTASPSQVGLRTPAMQPAPTQPPPWNHAAARRTNTAAAARRFLSPGESSEGDDNLPDLLVASNSEPPDLISGSEDSDYMELFRANAGLPARRTGSPDVHEMDLRWAFMSPALRQRDDRHSTQLTAAAEAAIQRISGFIGRSGVLASGTGPGGPPGATRLPSFTEQSTSPGVRRGGSRGVSNNMGGMHMSVPSWAATGFNGGLDEDSDPLAGIVMPPWASRFAPRTRTDALPRQGSGQALGIRGEAVPSRDFGSDPVLPGRARRRLRGGVSSQHEGGEGDDEGEGSGSENRDWETASAGCAEDNDAAGFVAIPTVEGEGVEEADMEHGDTEWETASESDLEPIATIPSLTPSSPPEMILPGSIARAMVAPTHNAFNSLLPDLARGQTPAWEFQINPFHAGAETSGGSSLHISRLFHPPGNPPYGPQAGGPMWSTPASAARTLTPQTGLQRVTPAAGLRRPGATLQQTPTVSVPTQPGGGGPAARGGGFGVASRTPHWAEQAWWRQVKEHWQEHGYSACDERLPPSPGSAESGGSARSGLARAAVPNPAAEAALFQGVTALQTLLLRLPGPVNCSAQCVQEALAGLVKSNRVKQH